jgi:hypothetical protein
MTGTARDVPCPELAPCQQHAEKEQRHGSETRRINQGAQRRQESKQIGRLERQQERRRIDVPLKRRRQQERKPIRWRWNARSFRRQQWKSLPRQQRRPLRWQQQWSRRRKP